MADEPKSPTPEQPLGEQGIFEPKPLNVDRLPVSGTVRAIRLGVFLLMISAGVLIWLALRNPFMRPVKRYYKALNKRDTAAMTEAFPEWLAGADTDEGTVTVEDMCAAIVSATKYYFGQDSKATVVLRKQQEVGEEYLTRIADGIFTQYQRLATDQPGINMYFRPSTAFSSVQARIMQISRATNRAGMPMEQTFSIPPPIPPITMIMVRATKIRP